MNKKLTIIVPVFNGEQFIERCLHSLTQQLTIDTEMIVINDGSNDATNSIISSRFKAWIDNCQMFYLSTSNGGVSAARNLGLDNASGEYVVFVDADDIVSDDYVATIIGAMSDKPDIIEFGYRNINLHDRVTGGNGFIHTNFGFNSSGKVLNRIFGGCLWYPFLRAIKRPLFNNLRFPVGVRYCEDLMTLSAVYKKASTIYSLSAILYNYRINPAGATLNTKSDYADNLIDFYRTIAHDQSFANKALKINLAFAIRGCVVKTTDPLGRLPKDIETDIRRLIGTPKLLLYVRHRYVIYAICGQLLYFIKSQLNN